MSCRRNSCRGWRILGYAFGRRFMTRGSTRPERCVWRVCETPANHAKHPCIFRHDGTREAGVQGIFASPRRRTLKKTLEVLMEQALSEKFVVYFGNAAHFVMGGVMGSVWSKKRVFARTSSGRRRFNAPGAINPLNQKLLSVTNETCINSIIPQTVPTCAETWPLQTTPANSSHPPSSESPP